MDHQSAMLAARTLTAARRSGTRIDGLPDGAVPQTLADGYQIQDVVVACHGEQVGAWKIGATHP
ncbi:MAG: hydratase, partial [Chromatiales bacterium]|nr:hydratase [Chromatiales bacterium]